MISGVIHIPAIEPGDEGIVTFGGVLNADAETATFFLIQLFDLITQAIVKNN